MACWGFSVPGQGSWGRPKRKKEEIQSSAVAGGAETSLRERIQIFGVVCVNNTRHLLMSLVCSQPPPLPDGL